MAKWRLTALMLVLAVVSAQVLHADSHPGAVPRNAATAATASANVTSSPSPAKVSPTPSPVKPAPTPAPKTNSTAPPPTNGTKTNATAPPPTTGTTVNSTDIKTVTAASVRRPAEIAATAVILSYYDIEPQWLGGLQQQRPCEFTADKAAQQGMKSIQFMPTVHWVGDLNTVQSYCYRDGWGGCLAAAPDTQLRWQQGLAACIAYAVAKNFTEIAINNHVDARDTYVWRALLKLNPTIKYANYSYEDAVLTPAAKAVRTSVSNTTKVWFSMSGEMGRSIFYFPNEWRTLQARQRLVIGGGVANPLRMVGNGINYQKACCCVDIPLATSPFDYAAQYPAVSKQQVPTLKLNVSAIQKLYVEADFHAISSYTPVLATFNADGIERALQWYAMELEAFNISIYDLIIVRGKDMLFNEFGIGGGDGNNNPSNSLPYMRTHPFDGVWWPYQTWSDPWANADALALRRHYWNETANFAQRGGGPRFKVTKIFPFTIGSWDAFGVHFGTWGNGGTWKDQTIVDWVTASNSVANNPPAPAKPATA